MSDNREKKDTDMNQSFAQFAEQAEKDGHVYIYKDNEPRFMVIDLEKEPQIEMSEDEKFEFVARRLLRDHKKVFTELAK
ncbi:MAG: hypothetical protein J5910_08945 [Lachnospiraceae bacterium]|nr:hypothetical protein [Lachnospiraceae bacterium]